MDVAQELPHEFLTPGVYFGESPRYRNGTLHVSDISGGKIYAIDVSSSVKEVHVEVNNQLRGMCFAPDSSLIYLSVFGAKLHRLNLKDGNSTLYADISGIMTGYSGYMVIARAGRVYLDDTGAHILHSKEPCPGRLPCIDPDGSINVAADKIAFLNALFICVDCKTLYNSKAFRQELLKFDISPIDGLSSNLQEVWTLVGVEEGGDDFQTCMIGIDGGFVDAEGDI